MATLTLIGEPFPDAEAAAHAEAARELTAAVAATAPRGCSARMLVAADRPAPTFASARADVERLPLKSSMLPMLWRTGVSARPLDGEFIHALTPMVALRSRGEDDGSQSSVMVPHALAWLAPETMGASLARTYRAFVKRAVKHADTLVTSTHAVAQALQERYGADLAVQVVPLAAPPSYLEDADSAERRAALGLPDSYIVTNALPGDFGRLEWLLDALAADPTLPDLAVIAGSAPIERESGSAEDPEPTAGDAAQVGTTASAQADSGTATESDGAAAIRAAIPQTITSRVHVVTPRELADVGAVLSGATLLALPQLKLGAGYEVLGALAAGLPVVHSGCPCMEELTLDAGVTAEDPATFARELRRLCDDIDERTRLGVLAQDRSRGFTWTATAMALWELHANL